MPSFRKDFVNVCKVSACLGIEMRCSGLEICVLLENLLNMLSMYLSTIRNRRKDITYFQNIVCIGNTISEPFKMAKNSTFAQRYVTNSTAQIDTKLR